MLSLWSCIVSPCVSKLAGSTVQTSTMCNFLQPSWQAKTGWQSAFRVCQLKHRDQSSAPRPCRLGLWTLHSQTHPAMLRHFQLTIWIGLAADSHLASPIFLMISCIGKVKNISKTWVDHWNLTLERAFGAMVKRWLCNRKGGVPRQVQDMQDTAIKSSNDEVTDAPLCCKIYSKIFLLYDTVPVSCHLCITTALKV